MFIQVLMLGIMAGAVLPAVVFAFTTADIDARLSDVASRYAAGDIVGDRLARIYANARDLLQAAARHEEVAKQYETSIKRGPKRLKELQGELLLVARRRSQAVVSSRERSLAFVEIERIYRAAESRRAALEDELFEIENRERALVNRPEQLRAKREALTTRVAELEIALGIAMDTLGDDIAIAERALLEVEIAARRAELRRLDQELLSNSIRLQSARAEREVASAALEIQGRRAAELEDLLLSRRRDAAKSVVAKTQRAQDVALVSHPVLRRVIDQNAALGRELSSVIEQQSVVADQRTRLETRHADVGREFERAQGRLKYAGYGTGLGQLLVDQRRRIPDLRSLTRGSKVRKQTVDRIGSRSIEIDDLKGELADTDLAGERLLLAYAAEHGEISDRTTIKRDLIEALQDQAGVLRLLAENYSNYLRTLGDAEFEAQQLSAIVRSYGDYLDQKIIWIPNAPMVGMQMLIDTARAVDWLVSVENWRKALLDAGQGIRRAPLRFGFWVLVLVVLAWARRPINRALVDIGSKVSNIHTDRFRYTLAAMAASLVLSLPWALVLWLGADVLYAADDPSEFSLAFAHALRSLVPIVFVFHWLKRLLRERGLGRQHLRWRDRLAADVRRSTTRMLIVFIPAYFLAMLFEHQHNASYQYGLGRLAFIVAMAAVILYVYRLVHPDGAMVRHLLLRFPGALITRFHLVLGWIALLLPIGFALLAAIGYYYTALNLNRYLLQTGFLVIAAIFVRSLAMRWLLLAESRLALKRARERRDALSEAGAGDGEAVEISEDDVPVDIATINAQTRMILSNLIGWSFALGLYFIWQSALPALGFLESVDLWEIKVSGEGGIEIQAITLATVGLAAIIVAVTVVAAKNLPGVLEIGLLQRLPLPPGSRYAITTLSQYLIIAVGFTVVLSALGVRWSQIQWMVAALSVGLGFGLQEIVANFISGLILLFERPIRVGDTVTIGDLTGKVAKIRIRATTIVDWDNKEIVVPNKDFITQRFVNWTLSDPVIRLIIKVGIAYGSDVAKALEVMVEAANEQEKVLQDPAPRALFLDFGDSSLDFEIQVYIRELADRLLVRHGINTAINEGFKRAGIEIPFPQRDLHLRSISPDGVRGTLDLFAHAGGSVE